ncbi:radical SAM protein [Mesoaciditoga lauensis]|uniref:radical SAM protein n=1 Tax=Mesoaciditoga lauensis TaxID=1495039 RepID=UPI0005619DC3|nr:radical SAM protein [Mesoaciditoga lauensis]
MKALLIDGYVDEPAQFGVPPYLSAYSRYAFGIARMCGYDVIYKTIDEVRNGELPFHDLLIVIGGVTVPGNYLGGIPMTVEEAQKIASSSRAQLKVLMGSMAEYAVDRSGGIVAKRNSFEGYDLKLWKNYEMKLYEALCEEKWPSSRYDLIDKTVERSAEILRQHPNFPDVFCEIELGMGCERQTHCSFCTEPLWGEFVSRDVDNVIHEVKALYENGARHFRLGRISNIFAYHGKIKPNIDAISRLYRGIREVAPELKTLHTDNANPGYIYSNLKDSQEVLKIIVENNTPGDVLSMGVESFDPTVIRMNNLKITFERFIKVLEMVNSIGATRIEGVPKILPGINILFGLSGERKETYRINYDSMMKILESGLLVRRVNVRKAMAFPDTPLYTLLKGKPPRVNEGLYKHFKYSLRKNFDHPMLKKVFPVGTILRDVIVEKIEGNVSYGRQIGTYAILVGIPTSLPLHEHVDCVVVSHGQRSLTAMQIPINLNEIQLKALKWIPGIGKKALSDIALKRPFKDKSDFYEKTKVKLPEWIEKWVIFK